MQSRIVHTLRPLEDLECEMCHRRFRFLTPWLVKKLLGGRVAEVVVSFPLFSSRLYSSASNSAPSNLPNGKTSLVALPHEPRQFYRRPLPASCIAFSTVEGRQIFKETLEMGFLESFFDLVPQLRTQVQPSYCGLSAMVMVLNSFEMDPGRVWKAPWRWYHEDMLTCCLSSEDLLTHGITLDQFQAIAKCNGLNVDLRQPTSPGETVETFRSCLLNVCSQSLSTSGTILVVSYDRKAVKQTGSGHYALVGGYHPKRDLILVLETAAFKYPPHWAPLTAIYNGMCSLDTVTGRPRGYMFITKAFHARTGLLSPSPHGPVAADVDLRDPSGQQHPSAINSPSTPSGVAPHVNQLVNQLTLFCLPDAAFSSSTSLLDPQSAGGRLRAVADEWSVYLSSTPLRSLGKTCCCLLQSQVRERGRGSSGDHREPCPISGPGNCSPTLTHTSPPQIVPAHRCECPCLIDTLLDQLLALLVKHRPPDFFFSCQPLWADPSSNASSTSETATQVIFELVSSATGRRARLALERLQHRSYEWLTSDSGGPLTYRSVPTLGLGVRGMMGTAMAPGSSVRCRRPACAMPHVMDPKIRATALLTAFLLAFPYHTVPRRPGTIGDAIATDDGGDQGALVEALESSHHLLYRLPLLPSQTCFIVLTPGTRNELTTLSNILAQLVSIRRLPGSRCIESAPN